MRERSFLALCITGSVVAGSALLGGCPATDEHAHLAPTAEGVTVLAAQTATPEDGVRIELAQTDQPLSGMSVRIPRDAFAEPRAVVITCRDAVGLPPGAEPLSPLISIDVGGGYADRLLDVTIPVGVDKSEHPLACYWDADSGLLEGIPTYEYVEGKLRIKVRHLSQSLVVLRPPPAKKGVLEVQPAFVPGRDDFPFPNYGSYVEPGGFCDGAVIAALWYHTNPELRGSYAVREHPLLFDGDEYWQNDVLGIKWVVMAGENVGETTRGKLDAASKLRHDQRTWDHFRTVLHFTRRPQIAAIYPFQNALIGHAVLVFRAVVEADGGYLVIWDPNYPGQERRIEYSVVDGFKPYVGGIDPSGTTYEFHWVSYRCTSTMLERERIAELWQRVQAGTIGKGTFPASRLLWDDPALGTTNELTLDAEMLIETSRADWFARLRAELLIDGAWQPAGLRIYDSADPAGVHPQTPPRVGEHAYVIVVTPYDSFDWTDAFRLHLRYTQD